MEAILRVGNKKIIASNDDLYNFVVAISTGEKIIGRNCSMVEKKYRINKLSI